MKRVLKPRRDFLFGAMAAALAARPAHAGAAHAAVVPQGADRVVIWKSKRKMAIYNGKKLLRAYRVSLGFSPKGHKTRQGDGRTPEGQYQISFRNPNSRYHLSLQISYPNAQDVARAKAAGVSPGGDIFIHGGPIGWRNRFKRDWTAGCVAVSDREIEEIWRLVPVGTPILIVA